MNIKFEIAEGTTGAATSDACHENVSILAVGAPEEWKKTGNMLPTNGTLAFVAFHEVNGHLLEELSPAAVVSPVLARGFDCIDLAQLLHALNYRGPYRAAAPNLPKPNLVEAEIAQMCPRLDFRILTTL